MSKLDEKPLSPHMYKELRKKAVKCRLERACIMIDDRMIFD